MNARDKKLTNKVTSFTAEFEYYTNKKLSTAVTQKRIFGKQVANPHSLEAHALMIIFLAYRFAHAPRTEYFNRRIQPFLEEAGAISARFLEYYRGDHSILGKMRWARVILRVLLGLIIIGTITLLIVRIINRISTLCGSQPAAEILMLSVLGLITLLSLALFIYDASKGKNLRDYKAEEINAEQLLNKFTPTVMHGTAILCTLYLSMLAFTLYWCFGALNEETLFKTADPATGLVLTLGILALISLIITVASYCDIAIGLDDRDNLIPRTETYDAQPEPLSEAQFAVLPF